MKTITRSLGLLFLTGQLCFGNQTQSLQSIQDAITGFVQTSLDPTGRYEISDAQLDPRLQLPVCERSLDIFAQGGNIQAGRNTVGVRCQGEQNWTIYSTVIVKSFKEVLVSTKPFNRNDTFNIPDIKTEIRDVSTLQQGYLTNPAELIGMQATRYLPAGSVLTRMHYAEPKLIRRGERVSIQSGKQGLLITSTGTALSDGVKGQQISVKNDSSKRVIQATVVHPGIVTVYF